MRIERLAHLIAVARGDEPADLLLTNARIVNSLTGEIEIGSVAIAEGRVAGLGDYTTSRETRDLGGRFLAPGLIDGHVHLESSQLTPGEYSRAVVPHGTTAIVADLHEVANVAGLAGMREIMRQARRLPLTCFFTAPSCVPATTLESGGASISVDEIRRVLRWPNVVGVGELMDFAAVVAGDPTALAKAQAAGRLALDGHAPGLRGKTLNAYLAAGVGSDHESTELEEGREKLRRGAHLMIREGSSERNLEALLPLVTDETYHRCLFVTDDRGPVDLLRGADMDALIRKAIRLGLAPIRALQLATLNPARYFGLKGRGAIAPGYHADLLVMSDLREFQVEEVYSAGQLAASGGQALFRLAKPLDRLFTNSRLLVNSQLLTDSVHVAPIEPDDLAPELATGVPVPVIEIISGQIVTRFGWAEPPLDAGRLSADPARDLLKLVVVERHRASGRLAVGLVRGFGLRRGALGTSYAHDSHNMVGRRVQPIVVVGADDGSIRAAITEIVARHGAQVAVTAERTIAAVSLPVAGLMSSEPFEVVAEESARLGEAASELGCTAADPFAILSFLALPVIPELRLTDRGLVDVAAGRLIDDQIGVAAARSD